MEWAQPVQLLEELAELFEPGEDLVAQIDGGLGTSGKWDWGGPGVLVLTDRWLHVYGQLMQTTVEKHRRYRQWFDYRTVASIRHLNDPRWLTLILMADRRGSLTYESRTGWRPAREQAGWVEVRLDDLRHLRPTNRDQLAGFVSVLKKLRTSQPNATEALYRLYDNGLIGDSQLSSLSQKLEAYTMATLLQSSDLTSVEEFNRTWRDTASQVEALHCDYGNSLITAGDLDERQSRLLKALPHR